MLDKQRIIDDLTPTLGANAARTLADVLSQIYEEFRPRDVKADSTAGPTEGQEAKDAPRQADSVPEPTGPPPAAPPTAETPLNYKA